MSWECFPSCPSVLKDASDGPLRWGQSLEMASLFSPCIPSPFGAADGTPLCAEMPLSKGTCIQSPWIDLRAGEMGMVSLALVVHVIVSSVSKTEGASCMNFVGEHVTWAWHPRIGWPWLSGWHCPQEHHQPKLRVGLTQPKVPCVPRTFKDFLIPFMNNTVDLLRLYRPCLLQRHRDYLPIDKMSHSNTLNRIKKSPMFWKYTLDHMPSNSCRMHWTGFPVYFVLGVCGDEVVFLHEEVKKCMSWFSKILLVQKTITSACVRYVLW